jgi:hypothetical protein
MRIFLAFSVFCLVFTNTNLCFAQKRIALRDAILRKIVVAEFKGLGGFNNKAVELVVTNKGKENIEITLERGEFLLSENPKEQRLLTAETVLLALQPKTTAKQAIYAFCSQKHNSSPSTGARFKASGKATKTLCDLMALVETEKYYDHAAQEAVWCITDNADIQWLMSENAAEEKALREFVAAAKGIDLAKLPKVKRTKYIYQFIGKQEKRPALDIDYTDRTGGEKGKKIDAAQKKRDDEDQKTFKEIKEMETWAINEIVGTLAVNIAQPTKLRIVIISPSGEQLAEVYKSEDVVAGKGKFPYKYQKYNLPRGVYKVQALDDRGGVIHSQDYELPK